VTDPAILDALTDLRDAAALTLGRLTLMDTRLTRRLDRLDATMAAVDDKLDALATAVGDAATELQALRDELANAAAPGDLSPDQAARFDAIIGNLRAATAEPVPPTP
jgi:hypothetical protein